MRRRWTADVPVLLAVAMLATAATAQAPLKVTGAWVRETMGGRPTTSAYAVIENPGATELRIVSVAADVAGSAEMHEMTRAGDMMKMAPVKMVRVPPHGTVEFKPGGTHLMLFDLKRSLKDGDLVTLTFATSAGGLVTATAAVKKAQTQE
jgi:copper(I)-binding protein